MLHLTGKRYVQRTRVLFVRLFQLIVGRQILFDTVHAFPFGRYGDEAFGGALLPLAGRPDRLKDGRCLADDSSGAHRHQGPLQLGVVVDGRDRTASHKVATAEHFQRLLYAARPAFYYKQQWKNEFKMMPHNNNKSIT